MAQPPDHVHAPLPTMAMLTTPPLSACALTLVLVLIIKSVHHVSPHLLHPFIPIAPWGLLIGVHLDLYPSTEHI
jgi:hypothetical protein